jgi:type VI protein secretion system component VasK
MIPTFVQEIIGTLVRAAVVFFVGWLTAHGGPQFTDDQVAKFVTEATPVAAVLVWSIWVKYRGRQKLLTAQAAGQVVSERAVEMLVGTGQAPSVLTPKHEEPALEPKRPDILP